MKELMKPAPKKAARRRKAPFAGRRGKWPEFARFALTGGLATALHYGSYLALRLLVPAGLAYTLGYALSLVANFYLTAFFTFGRKPSWGRALGFGGAHLANYLLHMGLLGLFLRLGIPPAAAPLPVFAVAVPANFLLVRLVFRRRGA